MRNVPTLLRLAEHQALSELRLSGAVLDLGGERHGQYRAAMQGTCEFTTVNMDPKAHPDIVHDLETPLPFGDHTYAHTLLVNVLEHIYQAEQLLSEAARVTRPGGTVTVVVPFMFPIHADPGDYWRFTNETLIRMSSDCGLENSTVRPLGSGVCATCYLMVDRLLPTALRMILFYTLRYLVAPLDRLASTLARALKKKYRPEDYALGYCLTATVPKV